MDKHALNKSLIRMQYGDNKAFENVYNLTNKGVFSMCLSIVKDAHEAEDAMMATYIKVREKINFYKPNTNGYAWILTLCKNLCINEYKKRKREQVIDFVENEFLATSEDSTNKYDIPIFSIAKQVLNDAELQIVLMYAVSGYKHKEIAEILDKPLGTVLWSYNNALKKLKSHISAN